MSVLGRKKVDTGTWVEHKLETYFEHGQNIPRPWSKHTSRTLEHGQKIPRPRSIHTSSAVKTYLEKGQNNTYIDTYIYTNRVKNCPTKSKKVEIGHESFQKVENGQAST